MTISSTTSSVVGRGNGATTAFSYAFKIPTSDDVRVIHTDTSGNETTLASSLYSISGLGSDDGGTVTYPLTGSPMATGSSITISRVLSVTQPTALKNQGGYFPTVVEAALDRIVMLIQQAIGGISTVRALLFPASDVNPTQTLPPQALRANKYLAFDVSGNPVAMPGTANSPDLSANTVIATGASASRALRARFADWLNVKDFGAVGDGATDDAAAIQAAITAALPGQAVFFPATSAYYRCASGLTLSVSGVMLIGMSAGGSGPTFLGGSHIKFDSGVSVGITITNASSQLYGNGLRDLKLTFQNTTGKLIYVDRAVELEFTDLDCWHSNANGHTATCFYLDATTPNNSTRWTGIVRFYGVRLSWFKFGIYATGDTYVTDVSVIACALTGLSPTGAGSIGCNSIGSGSYIGAATDIEGWDIGIQTGSGFLTISGVRFEASGTNDVKVAASAANIFVRDNTHASSIATAVSIANADRGRNVIDAVCTTNVGSLRSRGGEDIIDQKWVNGRYARQEIYNLNQSASPQFIREVWSDGAAATNAFGESITAAESDISGNSWPIKIGGNNHVYLYAGNTKRFTLQSGGEMGFNGAAAIAKPTITGSRGGNAALASLLTQLASYGLITDGTTA